MGKVVKLVVRYRRCTIKFSGAAATNIVIKVSRENIVQVS